MEWWTAVNLRENLRRYGVCAMLLSLGGCTTLVVAQAKSSAKLQIQKDYYVDCSGASVSGDGSEQSLLGTLAQANALQLQPGDRLLFKRGSICKGELRPQGQGNQNAPIRIGAYGDGPLPRIETASTDEAALELFNQEYWEIASLDLSGGNTYGVFAGGDHGLLHHLHFRDLHLNNVRGELKRKDSGLVVIHPSGQNAAFDDVEIDGILASGTSQWSGIYVSGASHVRVRNSMVHDVQGDGIVVFEAHDAVIERSAAWHTGMQYDQTIGTPNAIWTWHCTDCTVEDNEAFLTDSPGVDGGAFDIDCGNTLNAVKKNFGHDTAGYCVAVFAASGPTIDSVVADNLCIANAKSTRLAQRQGAFLFMTWDGGTMEGVEVRGNRIDWQPPGDTPAVQSGAGLRANGIALRSNEIWTTGLSFIDPALKYTGALNRYVVSGADAVGLAAARDRFTALPEKDSTLTTPPAGAVRNGVFGSAPSNLGGWQLIATVPSDLLRDGGDDLLRGTLVELKSAALQFSGAGLVVRLAGDDRAVPIARDWSLQQDGVRLDILPQDKVSGFSVRLVSPRGKVVRVWNEYPGPVDLGLALRQYVGAPEFSHLGFDSVRATD
jgi:hypothetical protein